MYLHADRNKTRSRDRYLVISAEGVWCNIRKFVGNQLRSTSYHVKRSECYKVPSSSHIVPPLSRGPTSEDDSEDNDPVPAPTPPHPPDIPTKLSTPATPPPVVPLSVPCPPLAETLSQASGLAPDAPAAPTSPRRALPPLHPHSVIS